MSVTSHTRRSEDLLAQRFVDQDLTATERLELVLRMGHDETFRRRVLALSQISAAAAELRSPLPPHFLDAVMRKIEARPTWRTRLARLAWQPRIVQWNMVGALAAATSVAILSGAVSWLVFAPRSAQPSSSRRSAPTAESATAAPASGQSVLVRLVVLQPDARTVQVAGDFNGWNPTQTSLAQLSSGAWAVTLPLEPGRYKYKFVVDGSMWVDDPFAIEQEDDGFGARNAVIDVREPSGGTL
jgi:hypothetical protein